VITAAPPGAEPLGEDKVRPFAGLAELLKKPGGAGEDQA
jgi:hypothetical protein